MNIGNYPFRNLKKDLYKHRMEQLKNAPLKTTSHPNLSMYNMPGITVKVNR